MKKFDLHVHVDGPTLTKIVEICARTRTSVSSFLRGMLKKHVDEALEASRKGRILYRSEDGNQRFKMYWPRLSKERRRVISQLVDKLDLSVDNKTRKSSDLGSAVLTREQVHELVENMKQDLIKELGEMLMSSLPRMLQGVDSNNCK